MDLNNLERGGLNDLQNFETDFDTNSVWENIQPRKKRRVAFWLWFGGAAVAVFLSTGLVFSFLKNSDSRTETSQVIDSQQITTNKNAELDFKNNETKKEVTINKTAKTTLSDNIANDANTNFEPLKTKSKTGVSEKNDYVTRSGAPNNVRLHFQPNQNESTNLSNLDFKIYSPETTSNIPEESNEKINTKNLPFLPLKFATLENETEPDFQLLEFEKSKIIPIKKQQKMVTRNRH